jgi:hypothetical protein
MINSNIIATFVILFVLFLCYKNNYETFSNHVIRAEYMNDVCSMSCCHKTWSTMDIGNIDPMYEPSSTMCDNGIDNGCLCVPIK